MYLSSVFDKKLKRINILSKNMTPCDISGKQRVNLPKTTVTRYVYHINKFPCELTNILITHYLTLHSI